MKKKTNEISQSVWVIEVSRHASIKVKKGQQVKAGDVLAVLKRRRIRRVFFPSWLKRKEKIWEEGGVKKAGEIIGKGDLLYEKKAFPWRHWRWFSPTSGEILAIDEKEGFLRICRGEKEEKLFSSLTGRVTAVSSKKIEITFLARHFNGRGIGKERRWGILTSLTGDYPLTAFNCRHAGKILVADRISFAFLKKSFVLGVRGVVSFSFPELNIVEKEIPLPVLLLEKREKKMLKRELVDYEDNRCFLDASNNQLLVCLGHKDGEEN